jgi:hypothetical protein
MHFLVIKKNCTTKRHKITLTTFWKKLMNNTGIFDLVWLKLWFQKNLRRKLSSKVLVLLRSGSGTGSGSRLSKNAGSGSVLNQSGSTTLLKSLLYNFNKCSGIAQNYILCFPFIKQFMMLFKKNQLESSHAFSFSNLQVWRNLECYITSK